MIATAYQYPTSGAYNQTIAILPQGRATINTQYGDVTACRDSDPATLDGIDISALIAEAREHGKFGYAPRPRRPKVATPDGSACPICHTYCLGDCQAQ